MSEDMNNKLVDDLGKRRTAIAGAVLTAWLVGEAIPRVNLWENPGRE